MANRLLLQDCYLFISLHIICVPSAIPVIQEVGWEDISVFEVRLKMIPHKTIIAEYNAMDVG